MTHAISVPTPFNDISELAENFASRVDDERLMLPHDQTIPEGEWVQFTVTLADGSPALAGTGRCTGAYDNGEDRAPEHRFDVVMDNLQLDEMAQIYFERVLQVRAAQMGEEPVTGQVEVPPEEPEAADPAAFDAAAGEGVAPQAEAAYAAEDEFGGEATQAVSFDEIQQASSPADAEEEAGQQAEAAPAYSEPPAAAYSEPPAAAYSEPPAAAHSEPPVEAYAEPSAAYSEPPAEAHAEPMEAAGGWDEAQDASADVLSGTEMLESVEEVIDEDVTAAPSRSIEPPTELRIPAETAIYELPPPAPPGQLPSSHATNGSILTRRALAEAWSPEPMLRHDPMPSSGLFQYAVGAGLPVPSAPPRPDLDPTLRVAPAPRPGDPHAAPAAMTAAAPEAYDEPAYDEAPQPVEEHAFGADETMEGIGIDDEGDAAAHEGYADAGEAYDEVEPMASDADEAVVVGDDETMAESELGFDELPDQGAVDVGDETAVAFELPDDDERQ